MEWSCRQCGLGFRRDGDGLKIHEEQVHLSIIARLSIDREDVPVEASRNIL